MPIYEFVCKSCGKESEILVPRQNWDGIKCPHCHSSSLEKKLSLFSSSSSSSNTFCGSSICHNPERKASGCCGGCCHHH